MATETKHPRGFAEKCLRLLDVLQNPIGDNDIGTRVLERPASVASNQTKLVDVLIPVGIWINIDTNHPTALAAQRAKVTPNPNGILFLRAPPTANVDGHPI